MIKNWLHDIALTVRSRTGITPALVVWMGIAAVAALTVFIFLCVAGYDWLAIQFGSVFAALIMAGVFLLIAVIAIAIGALSRRHARERAILERAARAHAASSWLLDPKILGTAVQLGRTFGWQRLIPVALLGVLAAQWAREYRAHGEEKPKQ